MNIINKNMKWIMLVSGILTCTMLFAVISPQSALQTTFGESLNTALADMVVRSWGFLVFLMGAMLIYGAYRVVYRKLILTVVGASKVFFISLIIVYGYSQVAMTTMLFDSLMVILYFLYLVSGRQEKTA